MLQCSPGVKKEVGRRVAVRVVAPIQIFSGIIWRTPR